MGEKVVNYFKSSRMITHLLLLAFGAGGGASSYGFASFVTEKHLDERLAAEKEIRHLEFNALKDYMKLRFDFLDKNIYHNYKHRRDE